MSRKHTAILLCLLVAATTMAIGGPAFSSAAPIKMITFDWGEFLLKDFEAKTGLKVELTIAPFEERYTKIVSSFASGKPYDIIIAGFDQLPQFARSGWLESLDDKLPKEYRDKIFDYMWDIVSYKGHVYGIPWFVDTDLLLYNAEMLEKAGIKSPPTTWEEMVQDCLRIKNAGIVKYPLIWQGEQRTVAETWERQVYSFGGKTFDADLNTLFNDETGVKALESLVDTVNKYQITGREVLTAGRNEAAEIFMAGQAAFFISPGTKWYAIANDPAKSKIAGKVKATLIPGTNGKVGKGRCVFSNWTLAKGGDMEKAWKYVEFMTSEPSRRSISAKTGYLSAMSTVFDDPAVQKTLPIMGLVKKQLEHSYVCPTIPWSAQFYAAAGEEIHNALLGRKTAKKAMDDLAKKVSSWPK